MLLRWPIGKALVQRREPSGGAYRRSILIVATGNQVQAHLEDDFHRFSVSLHHNEAHIIHIEGRALRFPWLTCAEAVFPLERLVGMELSRCSRAVFQHADGRFQCTHLFDLSGLAVAQAARGPGRRRYDIVVFDPQGGGRRAELKRDGEKLYCWRVRDDIIEAAPPFGRQSLLRLGKWAGENLAEDEAEAALVLRRAIHISGGRWFDLDSVPNAATLGSRATCHSFQPSVAPKGKRMVGATRDFSDRLEDLLSDVDRARKIDG